MRLPDWRRQAVVRALVMDELSTAEIAAECGVSVDTVRNIRRELDTPEIETTNAGAK